MYIIHEDAQGPLFAEALLRKAAEGVQVRVLYDWMGGFGKTSRDSGIGFAPAPSRCAATTRRGSIVRWAGSAAITGKQSSSTVRWPS